MSKLIRKNCAIYTRKSSENGLEKEYNSLDAQRDACENYIKVKAHENWKMLPDHYDDGGISGGTLERPALQRMMEDIRAGKVDVVVVYKIDRLSRSMFDFLGMIKFFDEHNVSFVSVTQDLNTDTAMGRLVLNVLQSFAQFEREIASERIKDKIALSKEKGMWMGGTIPLGYDAEEGKLSVNEDEAKIVQHIFDEFIKTGSATEVVKDLKTQGYQTKARKARRGTYYPAKDFTKSSLYQILNNKLYIGKIEHKEKDKVYEGLHKAIIDMKNWNQAQAILSGNTRAKISLDPGERPFLLKGILQDPDGYAITPSTTKKKNKKYRYYVSIQAVKKSYSVCPLKTISAPLLEEVVLDQTRRVLTSTEWVNRMLASHPNEKVSMHDVSAALKNFGVVWEELFPAEQARIVQLVIHKIAVHPNKLIIEFHPPGMASVLHELLPELTIENGQNPNMHESMILEIPIDFKKRHKRKIITAPNGEDLVTARQPKFDNALLKAVVRAHEWQDMLDNGDVRSIRELADQEKLPSSYVANVMQLTNLAPDITTAIVNGRQPQSLQLKTLMTSQIPHDWDEQRQALGFAA
ncbi:MAG: recombinase family protein [Rhodospirillales bacterium]|nr:recombinase family protein [Rhodospirillales bacterium]MCB9964499.1 recombinase family protein [Rhodospirillales bacterium]MCB9973772.1 recombinase family protein [Rhodospirillales bacterium]MCB9980344.1 recombinase family protein [Rhodospirillales bacterium]